MKNRLLSTVVLTGLIIPGFCLHINAQSGNEPPAHCRRPADFEPFRYEYSLHQLKDNFSEEMMRRAAGMGEKIRDVNDRGDWKPVLESLDRHKCPEWFKDAKFGMFIDWGPWSVGGWAKPNEGEPMYPDWYEKRMYGQFREYHEKYWGEDFERDDLLPLFTNSLYDPEKLTDIARNAGMKYVVPFCKHHGGFCLWPSTFTHRNAEVMGPGRDLIGPLVKACRRKDLNFGFYFSLDEWEYPLIEHDGNMVIRSWAGEILAYETKLEKLASGKMAVKNFSDDYIIPQAVEFIDMYDPDILWFDGEWDTPVEDLGTYTIVSYFYNNASGRKKVAVNDRFGKVDGVIARSKHGDFYTSEYHSMDAGDKAHPWEECRGISQSFGYNWQDTEANVITTQEFVNMFLEIVSEGGNLLLIVNLDGRGALPDIQAQRLESIGQWLKVNGEGIYNTRNYQTPAEGNVRFTRSKDNQTVYAISTVWPGEALSIKSVIPKKDSRIYMLGDEKPLNWKYDNEKGITIEIPARLQNESNRPCKYAYSFRIENITQ
jgi:alpha-L-fucosidase